ncbi:DUF4185 domain-containing protein [Antrihabitans cavernicola]|uniref:DUF4185 domain-containing protein n=1 Tax=Antrihabitans cavernicola TaxID=2495913 RepID=A0A5A7S4I9_9NOCA|nr:DUF4185 domain-containing protein [Spelaeibacter cavernicola]KAA0017370.1 DUF4185 domain-containing protein [Spelaeibacter cavernicola]
MERRSGLTGAAAVTLAALTFFASPADAVPGGVNPIPYINGTDGQLPHLTGRTQAVSFFTGPSSPNNTVGRFNVLGTDLGVMWDNGHGQVLTAFGDTVGLGLDTFSANGIVGDWRSNVLFRSSDHVLSDGMGIDSAPLDNPIHAKELVRSLKIPGVETSVIPTAGVEVGGIQYMNFMSVRSWGPPGEWDTNFSGLASSPDNGENWFIEPPRRTNLPGSGDHNFQMAAYVKEGGYVYQFGTPSGRFGDARLARVPEAAIRDLGAYEYWTGKDWKKGDVNAAVPVLPAPVSELSVQYNDYLGQYIALYADQANNIVMRKSASLTGPWGPPESILGGNEIPQLYGAYIHPWSTGSDLYFLVTTYRSYNVMLMHTRL